MAIETINQQDSRFPALNRGNNARFPPTEADAASRIVLCDNANDAAEALQKIVSAGLRPTIRSGGHCYEDFVYTNPKGAILDPTSDPENFTVTKMGIDATRPSGRDFAERLVISDEQRRKARDILENSGLKL